MDFRHRLLKGGKVEVGYTVTDLDGEETILKRVLLTDGAFDDLLTCFGNSLRRLSYVPGDAGENRLWDEADEVYRYFTGESSLEWLDTYMSDTKWRLPKQESRDWNIERGLEELHELVSDRKFVELAKQEGRCVDAWSLYRPVCQVCFGAW